MMHCTALSSRLNRKCQVTVVLNVSNVVVTFYQMHTLITCPQKCEPASEGTCQQVVHMWMLILLINTAYSVSVLHGMSI